MNKKPKSMTSLSFSKTYTPDEHGFVGYKKTPPPNVLRTPILLMEYIPPAKKETNER